MILCKFTRCMKNMVVVLQSSLNIFNQSHFTSHRENAINKLSIDLLSNKHIISENWASRHNIYTSVESENLKKKIFFVHNKIENIEEVANFLNRWLYRCERLLSCYNNKI